MLFLWNLLLCLLNHDIVFAASDLSCLRSVQVTLAEVSDYDVEDTYLSYDEFDTLLSSSTCGLNDYFSSDVTPNKGYFKFIENFLFTGFTTVGYEDTAVSESFVSKFEIEVISNTSGIPSFNETIEVDSIEEYFFQIKPPVLSHEIHLNVLEFEAPGISPYRWKMKLFGCTVDEAFTVSPSAVVCESTNMASSSTEVEVNQTTLIVAATVSPDDPTMTTVTSTVTTTISTVRIQTITTVTSIVTTASTVRVTDDSCSASVEGRAVGAAVRGSLDGVSEGALIGAIIPLLLIIIILAAILIVVLVWIMFLKKKGKSSPRNRARGGTMKELRNIPLYSPQQNSNNLNGTVTSGTNGVVESVITNNQLYEYTNSCEPLVKPGHISKVSLPSPVGHQPSTDAEYSAIDPYVYMASPDGNQATSSSHYEAVDTPPTEPTSISSPPIDEVESTHNPSYSIVK